MEFPDLTLPFLGRRDYLHGTTLIDALLPLLPPDAEMVFKFSHMIRSNRVAIGDGAGDASLAWKSAAAGPGAFHVQPLPAIEPISRRPYPEPLVGERAEVAGKSARYTGESPFSFVSTLVPLHKALLAANVHPAAAGQWVFTRLDLKQRPTSFQSIELQLAGVFQDQLAHSKILVEGEPLGAIYFSWLAK